VTPSILQAAILKTVGDFLQTIVSAGTTVVVGQVNRVPQPQGDCVVMWPLRMPRLATNVDGDADASFTGSIADTLMTVESVEIGVVVPGRTLFGDGVTAGTIIGAQQSGPTGGPGTYLVAPSQTVAETAFAAGGMTVEQSTEFVMQVDVHGPSSGDNAQVISTLFRDGYAVDQLDGTGVTPLFAEEPRQMPFITGADQYEDRWTVDLHMQVNPVVTVPQQYADALDVDIVSVDAAFPA
jgi:hypothetical protein